MNYTVIVSSKNKTSLINFFKFFDKEVSYLLSSSLILAYSHKKTRCRKVSVLKSPHVNKSAQVHFSSYKFSKQISIFSKKPGKLLLFFKKMQSNLFPDVVVETHSLLKTKNKLSSKFLNPNKFVLDSAKLLASKNQALFAKKNSRSAFFIKKLTVSKRATNNKKNEFYKIFSNNIINYLHIWDCYGEAVFLGSK